MIPPARSNDALHAELFEFMPNIFEKLVEERCGQHEQNAYNFTINLNLI